MIHLEEITVIDAPHRTMLRTLARQRRSPSGREHPLRRASPGHRRRPPLVSPELSQQVTWRAETLRRLAESHQRIQLPCSPPTYFQATMVKGIFRSIGRPTITFAPSPPVQPRLRDDFRVRRSASCPGAPSRSPLPPPLHAGSPPAKRNARHQTNRPNPTTGNAISPINLLQHSQSNYEDRHPPAEPDR